VVDRAAPPGEPGGGALHAFSALPLQRTELPGGLEFHHVEAGQGPALVLAHGVMGDWRTWEPQWPAFTPHFRTISYSRRYSVPNRNTQASPDHSALVEAQDLAGLLQAWRAEPAILVGSSYGAYTALALAVARPAMVRALVLLEPPMLRWADFTTEGRAVREAFDRDIRGPARTAFEAGDIDRGVALLTGGIVGAKVLAGLSPETMRRRRENERSLRMLTLSSDEFPMISPEAVRALAMPTLLLAGADTPPIHDTVFRALCAAMPQAESARIPDAGHGAARDNPADFNARVLEFLTRRVLAGSQP
jgi:pimeloyl-ACP methyl ester carboxylesterase